MELWHGTRAIADRQARRTGTIGFKVTPEERAEIERRAERAGHRLSDYIRLLLLSDRPGLALQPRLSPELGRQLAVELARVGTNLNQLAHHANATHALPDRVALEAAIDAIVAATEALIRL